MSKLRQATAIGDSTFHEKAESSNADLRSILGFYPAYGEGRVDVKELHWLKEYVTLKLSAFGHKPSRENELMKVASSLLTQYSARLSLSGVPQLSPPDTRVQTFLRSQLDDSSITIPSSLHLDRHGMARLLSFPPDKDEYKNSLITSYRTLQGVLHNPATAARTTKGTFHIAEGSESLPIPGEKICCPNNVYKNILKAALNAPDDLLEVPYDSNVKTWLSLYLTPVVVPGVPGVSKARRMEVRVLMPGASVSTLDFLESVFGNAGDPFVGQNDLGIDETWSGHTGMIICAPHIRKLRKKDIGLPHWDEATERQREHGMCWKDESELYHNGGAFNLWFRTKEGIAVTIITDSYFGYYKKTVKAFLSYASNLCYSEEEHAGGCVAYSSYNLGRSFNLKDSQAKHWDNGATLKDVTELMEDWVVMCDMGFAVDKRFPDVYYVHEDSFFNVNDLSVTFPGDDGKPRKIKLLRGKTYVLPCGYRLFLEADPWKLVGQTPEGLFCHKPASVSGSGKSEISKPITNQIIKKPFFVDDLKEDIAHVYTITTHDYSTRFKDGDRRDLRSFLSPKRSLGSSIKLLTPNEDFCPSYNTWLENIPTHVRALAFLVKQIAKEGEDWQSRLGIQIINGTPGHELMLDGAHVIANYLRVGFEPNGEWKLFRMRADFSPSGKIAMEDDISTSVVVPIASLDKNLLSDDIQKFIDLTNATGLKMATNCEYRFFQRPDDAKIPGADKEAERDIAQEEILRDFVSAPTDQSKPKHRSEGISGVSPSALLFACNFEPQDSKDALELVEDCVTFDKFTEPMKRTISTAVNLSATKKWVCSSKARLVDVGGEMKPTPNPRYLQTRPDLVSRKGRYLCEVSARLARKVALSIAIHIPVGAVIMGRRCNSSGGKVRSMSCFNPLGYLELPEAFLDLMSCLTGKSPSTYGAGVEWALTKGPFNALLPAADLNNAFVSTILSATDLFFSSAGVCGENARIDHDITFLIPEIFCRMTTEERTANYLVKNGFMEKLEDFEFEGQKIFASRLGYRINRKFSNSFLGRIFDSPHKVFTNEMLKPETQDKSAFIDSIRNICEAQQRVCISYCNDGTVDSLVPPLAYLCRIVAAGGEYEGMTLQTPEFREMFKRDYVLNSDWYKDRLRNQLNVEKNLVDKKIGNVKLYVDMCNEHVVRELDLDERLNTFEGQRAQLEQILDPVATYYGFIGVDGCCQ
ncbi:hypothetical protein GEMRC1_005267 [Eukaryota sp. GEM-RC1]